MNVSSSGPGRDDALRFEAIFARCYPPVLAYARRREADRAAAEEVAAETLLIAWRRLDDLPEDPLPWLIGAARKVLANQRRGARRRTPDGPSIPIELVEDADTAVPLADRVADRVAFAASFEALRPGDREVLALVAWDGLSSREAGEVLGCSAAVFSVRLHRARRRLMKELRSRGHSLVEPARVPSSETRPDAEGAR